MRVVKAYWWIGRQNFGDLLTPFILERFAHVPVRWAPAVEADLVMVGSILEHLPESYSGMIVGSGKMFSKTKVHFPNARIMALRGPLTAEGVPGSYALGDAALLANRLVGVQEKRYKLGIVPHWSDAVLEYRHEFKEFKPRIIRPTGDPLEVIREIGRCYKIVSSSLHGVIVADSFGIPRRMEIPPRLLHAEGGTFKFEDHCAALEMPCEFGQPAVEAPRYMVQDLQQKLYDVLERVGESYV